MDEWIYFFKNAEIKSHFSAKGLKEANEKLDTMKLNEKDRKAYNAYLKHLHSIASRNHTIEIDAKEIIKKAKEESEIEAVIGFFENDVSISVIAKSLKITKEPVKQIIENHKNK
ncbi:MAG: hypothetical protein SGI94_15580 [Saprospiraceae bacterium]|nr:hypothetical protein [Saprospiraceae bacterium]